MKAFFESRFIKKGELGVPNPSGEKILVVYLGRGRCEGRSKRGERGDFSIRAHCFRGKRKKKANKVGVSFVLKIVSIEGGERRNSDADGMTGCKDQGAGILGTRAKNLARENPARRRGIR